MIFITNDDDFDNYKSKYLIFEKDLTSILSEISNYYDLEKQTHYIPMIKEILEKNAVDITQYIVTGKLHKK